MTLEDLIKTMKIKADNCLEWEHCFKLEGATRLASKQRRIADVLLKTIKVLEKEGQLTCEDD